MQKEFPKIAKQKSPLLQKAIAGTTPKYYPCSWKKIMLQGEWRMLTMTQINLITKMFYEEGKNISQISRETGYDRKTIRSYIDKTDWNIELPAVYQKPSSRLQLLDFLVKLSFAL